MRHIVAAICLLLVPLSAGAQVLDEIVAVVGDQIILKSEVDAMVAGALQQGQAEYSDELWVDALNQLVDFKVMAAEARRDTTIKIEDDQVEQALTQRIDQLAAQVGGRSALEELYGKPMAQIRSELREDFRDQLAAERLQRTRLQRIRITPTEVRQWFEDIPSDSLPVLPETVRLSHIVRYPQITEAAREEARTILTAIRDSIVNSPVTIEEMARQFSDDPGSASRGGQYSFTRLSDLEPEFAAVASRMPLGEISQIFETRYGPHILRVNDRRGDMVDFNHILIQYDLSKADPADAIEYLTEIRDSVVVHDQPFALMARRHSEEEASAKRGGRVVDERSGARDLPLEALDQSWQQTIAGMEQREISEPSEVELLDGRQAYHILRLEDRMPQHRVSLESDYDRIEDIALQEKQQQEFRTWLDELRNEVFVELRGKAKELALASD